MMLIMQNYTKTIGKIGNEIKALSIFTLTTLCGIKLYLISKCFHGIKSCLTRDNLQEYLMSRKDTILKYRTKNKLHKLFFIINNLTNDTLNISQLGKISEHNYCIELHFTEFRKINHCDSLIILHK